jgi:hypothetical protein
MQFSSPPSGPGSRDEDRRGAVGSLVAAYEGAEDAEGGVMVYTGGETSTQTVGPRLILQMSLG